MGRALAALVMLVFSPLFPIITVSVCAVSYVLAFVFHLPQFGLWVWLAQLAVAYSKTNVVALVVLIAFVFGSIPLARIGFREHAVRPSGAIGGTLFAAIIIGGTIWWASAWPYDPTSGIQVYVFGFLLFWAWSGVCESAMSAMKLIAQNRPQPGPEVVVKQKAHGDARVAGEAEALSLLKKK
jgi:hypothetical protein